MTLPEPGPSELEILAPLLAGCGFDAGAYLAQNPDLAAFGPAPPVLLDHFLRHGVREGRTAPCGPFPCGLAALRAAGGVSPEYRAALFCSVWFGQIAHPDSTERMWQSLGAELTASVRAMGGIPYYVIGDSHTGHYSRRARHGARWLAPLPLPCLGASARELLWADNHHGARILRWAQGVARLHGLGAPVFLKFGGIDSEFHWAWHRARHAIYTLSLDRFAGFAQDSVARYGHFLDRLTALIDRRLIRVCSVFPAVLADANFIGRTAELLGGTPERTREVAVELAKLELPDRAARTRMRAEYNALLRAMCDERSLIYIDDFTPLLGPDGVLAEPFYGAHGGTDHHLDHAASEAPLVAILRAYAETGP